MTVFEKNGRWNFRFQIKGKEYWRAVPEATTKREAEKAEAVFKGDLLHGKYDLAENLGEMPFSKLISAFTAYGQVNRTGWYNDKYTVNYLAKYFNGMKIKDVTSFVIEKYKFHRKEKGLAPATINREVAIISKMFSIAVDSGWTNENPCRKIKPIRQSNRVERYLTHEEEQNLLAGCVGDDDYMRPIIILALHTGMRKGEILSLKWEENVDLKQRYFTLYKTKSGKMRKIPISDTLFDELVKLNNHRISEYVFTNPITKTRYENIKKAFKRICKNTNITNLRFHDLRHTAATRMVTAGIDLVVVKEILGHADIETTMRYSHPVPERKKQAIDALNNFYKSTINIVPITG